MSVTREYDYIFVSNPRAASLALNGLLGWGFEFNHLPARWIRNLIGEDQWLRAFTFGVVRHPFDRLVSWFFFHQQLRQDYPKKEIYQRSFRSWILAECPHHWDVVPEFKLGWLKHPLNQWEYFYDGDTPIVDLIGRYEKLDSFVDQLRQRIKIPEKPLDVANSSDRTESFRSCFDDETREIAYRLFREDFERFGYEP